MSMKNRKLTGIDIGREFIRPDGRLRASVTTIRSTLRRRGLFGRVARKKPLLTFAHIQRRMRWAKAHKDWTPEQWKCVVWSDEATFRLFPTTGKVYVRRGKGEEYKPQCVSPTVKYGGGKVSVWVCCHAGGVGQWLESILSYFIICVSPSPLSMWYCLSNTRRRWCERCLSSHENLCKMQSFTYFLHR